ncbi:hypothetical protein BIW11_05708, partial [Tropilaelaps mercedesae]
MSSPWDRRCVTELRTMLAEEIEELVNELLQEQNRASDETKSSLNEGSNWESGRCAPAHIGGSALAIGVSRTGVVRACSRLRCASCDIAVVAFEGARWYSDTDYLFLRNHAPCGGALREKLTPAEGSRAYACQCRWVSLDDGQVATPASFGLRWFC